MNLRNCLLGVTATLLLFTASWSLAQPTVQRGSDRGVSRAGDPADNVPYFRGEENLRAPVTTGESTRYSVYTQSGERGSTQRTGETGSEGAERYLPYRGGEADLRSGTRGTIR